MHETVPILEKAGGRKPLIGVIHLRPLPGSPRWNGEGIETALSAARRDAETILEAGFDGWILENFGDMPFLRGPVPPHVTAAMTRIAVELPRGALCGVNVLRNDAAASLAVAAAAGLDLIRVNVHTGARVTDQGIIEGEAAGTTRMRGFLGPSIAILADVDVKHSVPLGAAFDLADSARDTAYRGLADGLIVTGKATGSAADLWDLKTAREAVPDRPLFVGSGLTLANVREMLKTADGVIVGVWIKQSGRIEEPVDAGRAREFVAEARG